MRPLLETRRTLGANMEGSIMHTRLLILFGEISMIAFARAAFIRKDENPFLSSHEGFHIFTNGCRLQMLKTSWATSLFYSTHFWIVSTSSLTVSGDLWPTPHMSSERRSPSFAENRKLHC